MIKSNLSSRKKKILMCMLEEKDWVTSKHLAYKLNVSDRTIRSDIKELRRLLSQYKIDIRSVRGEGYCVYPSKKLREFLSSEAALASNFPEHKYIDVAIKLLNINGPKDIDELSDEFYVCRSTLENEIKQVRNFLRLNGERVSLVRKKNTVEIQGDEKSKRLLINSLIIAHDHSKVSLDLKKYARYFDYSSLREVKNIVSDELKNHNISMPDVGVIAIVIHIMIAVQRIQNGWLLNTRYVNSEIEGEFDKNVDLDAGKRHWEKTGATFIYFDKYLRTRSYCLSYFFPSEFSN